MMIFCPTWKFFRNLLGKYEPYNHKDGHVLFLKS